MPDKVGLEYHEQTSLWAISNKARHQKGHRFGNLYRELNEALLRKAWRRLNKSSASGVDRVSAHAYAQDLEANIADLVGRLKSRRYKARLVRRKYIPKDNGKQRPLGIPAVEDKLLQTAVSMLVRYADDFVAAFQYQKEAQAFYRALPKRLGKFRLEVAPEKTQLLRFSRFHPSRKRTFVFLGFEYYWDLDRQGERRLKRRTARAKITRSLKDFTEWVKTHRHLLTKKLFAGVARKLRGHYNYFGLPGNYQGIREYHLKVLDILFKWLKRRNRRHRMNGWRFHDLVERLGLPEPKIVPYPRSKSLVLD